MIEGLSNAVDRLKTENQRWCDCVVAQFEYHRQTAKAGTQKP
jgi:hypothetical protein